MSTLDTIEPHTVIDARGTACPGPLMEAKKGIAKVPIGGIMEVRSSDDGTNEDLPLWVKFAGHEFLGVIEAEGYSRLFIKRKK